MTLDDAVKVLNERRYGIDDWRDAEWTKEGGDESVLLVDKGERDQWDYHESLNEFEAIAIAKELERQAGRDMPATRRVIAAFRAVKDQADKAFYSDVLGRVPAGDCLVFDIGAVGRISYADIEGFLAEWESRP